MVARVKCLIVTLWAIGCCGQIGLAQQANSQPHKLDAAALFKKCSNAVVTINTEGSFGSGVLIDSNGVVVTNLHVIRGARKATVTLANKDAYDDVGVIEVDERKDLALLKLKGFKLPSSELGDSDSLSVGHAVFAIGAPQGLELTLSTGIVSAIRDSGDGYQVLQTNAAISPGSSGGGLFDDAGRLVGITTFHIKNGENLNFAIPVNYVRGLMGATVAKYTLADLAERFRPGAQDRLADSQQGQGSGPAAPLPTLAKLYVNTNGSMAVVQQKGSNVTISWSTAAGVIYGTSTFTWDANAQAFLGKGSMKAQCGKYDTRITDAPIQEQIYIVNDRVIRDRWTNPDKLDCSKGIVKEYSWQEGLWYVPDRNDK